MRPRRPGVALGVVSAVTTWIITTAPAAAAPVRVFVTSQDDSSVSEIDPASDRVMTRIATGKGPAGIAASETGDRIAVSHPDAKSIELIDVTSGHLRRLDYDGEPFGVALDGDAVYVSDWSKDRVARLDTTSGQITASVSVGKSPAGLAIDRANQRLYVANRESGGISIVDCRTMRVVGNVATGTAPFALAVAPDGKRVYVANVRSNDLAVVDVASSSRVASIAAGKMPYGVAVTADNREVLVTNQHGNSVTIVDAARHTAVATIPVGRYPEGVVTVEGRALVANWFSGDVSVIDLASRREVTRIKVGDGARNLAVLRDARKEH